RVRGFDRQGDAADQAAAANGCQERVEMRQVLDDLEADRALPRDDQWIVIGMDEDQVLRLGHLPRIDRGGIDRVALQLDLGAEACRTLDLGEGRAFRHYD